jgi:hypothetical protein
MLTTGDVRPPGPMFGEADSSGVFHAPLFADIASGRTAARGRVRSWYLIAGRSMVAGQRVLDIETEIGIIPVRTRSNGHLAEILAEQGAEVVPGQALWRYSVSAQAWG